MIISYNGTSHTGMYNVSMHNSMKKCINIVNSNLIFIIIKRDMSNEELKVTFNFGQLINILKVKNKNLNQIY